jgi:hypothetical protein
MTEWIVTIMSIYDLHGVSYNRTTFRRAGFSAVTLPLSNSHALQVISINTIVYSVKDNEPLDAATAADPAGQFALLAHALATCAPDSSVQPVIVGHISPAVGKLIGRTVNNNWMHNYTTAFAQVLDMFASAARPVHMWFAHQHEAAFRVLPSASSSNETPRPIYLVL